MFRRIKGLCVLILMSNTVFDMKEGGEFPRGTDLTVNVLAESTYEIKAVGLKVNGEFVGRDNKAPFLWDAKKRNRV